LGLEKLFPGGIFPRKEGLVKGGTFSTLSLENSGEEGFFLGKTKKGI